MFVAMKKVFYHTSNKEECFSKELMISIWSMLKMYEFSSFVYFSVPHSLETYLSPKDTLYPPENILKQQINQGKTQTQSINSSWISI